MRVTIYSVLTLVLAMGLLFSCEKEEVQPTLDSPNAMAQSRMDIDPVPAVDLVISRLGSTIAPTTVTSDCGVELLDVSCGGQRSFQILAGVTNVGTADLPAGSVQVLFADLYAISQGQSNATSVVTFSHSGIPAGGTIVVPRPYFVGPCPCGVNPNNYVQSYQALADPNNLISEAREDNNRSLQFDTCGGCL
ncbi:MAG: hypothetical protein AAFV95_09015 [Bacteroidota bacterium]